MAEGRSSRGSGSVGEGDRERHEESRNPGVLEILDELNFAAVAVDGDCRVVGLTRKTRDLPDLRDCRIGSPPRHPDRCAQERIRRYLRAQLTEPAEPGGRDPRSPLILEGSRGKPLVIKAVRTGEAGPAAAVALFFDLEASPAPSPEVLRHIFGFTQAEARLASRFAAGEGITQLARSLRISVGTVRQHLKSIFAKTACRRQGELLALLARLAALRLDDCPRPPGGGDKGGDAT